MPEDLQLVRGAAIRTALGATAITLIPAAEPFASVALAPAAEPFAAFALAPAADPFAAAAFAGGALH